MYIIKFIIFDCNTDKLQNVNIHVLVHVQYNVTTNVMYMYNVMIMTLYIHDIVSFNMEIKGSKLEFESEAPTRFGSGVSVLVLVPYMYVLSTTKLIS